MRFVCHSCRLFSVFLATLDLKAFDVKALRAFRVLRPLKLVSGVPSTYHTQQTLTTLARPTSAFRHYMHSALFVPTNYFPSWFCCDYCTHSVAWWQAVTIFCRWICTALRFLHTVGVALRRRTIPCGAATHGVCQKYPILAYPPTFGAPVWLTPFEFRRDLLR